MPGRKSPARPSRTARPGKANPHYWSAAVTRNSNALDLEPAVFTLKTPRAIAQSLKRSAEASARRNGTPYQSAMSMLTFYINRAGKNLSKSRLDVLNRAKSALRAAFGRM